MYVFNIYVLGFNGQTSRGGLLVGIFHHGFGVEHEDDAWLVSFLAKVQRKGP